MRRELQALFRIACWIVWIIAITGSVFLFGCWLFVGFYPIPKWIADYNVSRLSHQLYVGEPRAELVRKFGSGANVSDSHLLRYSWTSVSAVCIAASEGIDVRLDAAGRVGSWRRNDDGSAC